MKVDKTCTSIAKLNPAFGALITNLFSLNVSTHAGSLGNHQLYDRMNRHIVSMVGLEKWRLYISEIIAIQELMLRFNVEDNP